MKSLYHNFRLQQEKLTETNFIFEKPEIYQIKEKIEKIGKPLKKWNINIYSGIRTGFNEAFIIDGEKRKEILDKCKTKGERERTKKILKPVLRGRDISRYSYNWEDLWVIGTFPALKLEIDDYPSLKEYLKGFGERLKQDGKPGHRCKSNNKWFETSHTTAYYHEFEKEKIVWQDMAGSPSFVYDKRGYYTLQTAYIMTGSNLKFLLGVLNSKVAMFYLAQIAYSLSNGDLRWIKQYVERIPVPSITEENKKLVEKIEDLVDQILELKKQGKPINEKRIGELYTEIDNIIYQLYNLTEEEKKIINEKITKKMIKEL